MDTVETRYGVDSMLTEFFMESLPSQSVDRCDRNHIPNLPNMQFGGPCRMFFANEKFTHIVVFSTKLTIVHSTVSR